MIDPDRLRAIRTSRNLSRDRLADEAKVSARQIARIEGAAENVTARATTIERLAQALTVRPAVLSGDAPLPADVDSSEPSQAQIDAKRLRELRRRKRWSRQRLAKESKVSERQIARIEAAEGVTAVRATTVDRLARALRTDASTLKEPLESDEPIPGDVRIRARVSPKIRLAYDLIERRYGPSAEQLFVLAPLLFVLLAEKSLARRREKLEQVREAKERLESFTKEDKNLYFTSYLTDVNEGLAYESMSIEKADLLGDVIRDETDAMAWFGEDDIFAVTPFADYLCEFAAEIGPGGVSFGVDLVLDDFWGVEPYEICLDELNEVTGGSQRAKWALEYGDVRLLDIPFFLNLEDDPKWKELRALWLESKLSNDARKQMERRQKTIEQPITLELKEPEDIGDIGDKFAAEIHSTMAEIRAYQDRVKAERSLDEEESNNEGH